MYCISSYYLETMNGLFFFYYKLSRATLYLRLSDESFPIREKLMALFIYSNFFSIPQTHMISFLLPQHMISFLSSNTYNYFFSIPQHIKFNMTYVTRVCLLELNNLANKSFTTNHQASWLAHQTNPRLRLQLLHLR